MPAGPKGYQEYLESYNSHVGGQQRQTISVTDLISEGPIQGLVDGQASIYLNDDRAAPLSQAATSARLSKATISLTNNSTTATITDGSIVLADNGKKYLVVKKGYGSINVTATNPRVSSIDAAIHCTLTAGSSFFTTAMVSSISSILSYVPCTLVTTSDSDGEDNEGHGQGFISRRTDTTVATFTVGSGGGGGTWKPSGTYSLEVDRVIEISSISGSTVTLASAWAGTTGSYKYDVTGTIVEDVDTVTQTQVANYEALTTQFRVGTKSQEPFIDIGGHGSTSISNSPSAGGTIEQTSGYGDGTQAAKVLVGSSSAGFNLSAAQIQEVDEARFTWAYGSGHYAVSGKGNNQPTYTQYSITFEVKRPGQSSFENTDILNREVLHSGEYVNAVTFVQKIDLQQYRPFIDFKLTIKRMSNHTGPGYKSKGETYHDWQGISAASITNTTCVIKDKLSHPYCAMAKVGFTSQQFQGMPKRGYHARGLKVKVPSNYVTREENAGVSTYTRNVSTGVVTSTYQDWDGAFRRFAVYTNNPAWVFYDILTNNRYGLGDFLQEEHIDKYMLYRIARYCDELVDDGKGGTEPRFTCNLYFQKQADAYKVVKDIATVFRSMVYYFDGQVSPIIDAPSGPVYTFTKANVIDGAFSYEGTGSKTRINQCVVSWIDPDANYKASPLLVEDRKNIAETGKIISQDSVAMGAITEGQALRYGRWKLWTAANQREIVSFKSSLNSSFILPGDIINVQDADRYATRYGGRISNSGTTRSVSSIPLDSSVTLAAGSTYTLSVIFDQPGAFATETVTINGTVYAKGDLIKQAYIDSNGNGTYTLQDINTEEKAVNAKATSGGTDALILNWADTHRIETETVTTSSGTTNTITVQSAFSEVPNAEAMWVLTETTAGGSEVKGSAKQYKVLAVSQGANSEYSFTAVEHYDEKFAAVDEDFTTFVADTVYPAVRSLDTVPPVKDVRSRNTPEFAGRGGALRISWTPPTNVGEVLGTYEHLSGYEIVHNFDKVKNPIRVMDPNTTSILLRNLTVGTYSVAVRVINTLNNVSEPVIIKVHVSNNHKDRDIPRLVDDVPVAGTTTVGYTVDGNTFKAKRSGYGIKHPGSDSSWVNNTNTTATAWQQDCSDLPNITWSESDRNSEGEFIVEHAYILMDFSDATDRFKLLKYYKPTGSGTAHWYDTGTGNTTNRFGSALTGTFTKAAESSKVTGSGTAFTTQIEQGDVLKLGSEEIRVAAVESNTVLYLEVATDTAHSSVSGFIPNIRIDYTNDVIIARVYKTSSGLVLAETYSQIDAMLKPAGDYIEAGGVTNDEMGPDSVGNDEIADNAVGEDQINVSSVSAISANLGSITAGTMRSNVTDYIPDANAAPSGDENGAFIDLTAGKFVFGDANEYILWDGSNVTISGATISGASISGGSADVNATITVKEDGTTRLSSAGILNCTTALDVSASGAQATISHSNISRSDATSSASPSAGSTFTAVDSVTTNSQGHVTGINVKTITMPAGAAANDATITFSAGTYLGGGGAITVNQSSNETITFNHDNTSRTDTTSSASPAHGSTFTAVDSVTTNTQGHITAANLKTITLPAEATVNNATLTISAGTALGGGGNFTANQSSNETLTINHDNISRSNTTSTAAPGYGSTFTAIGGVSSNSQGHITGVETKTITIPASDNTNTFRTIKVDTSGNGSANNTLTSTEDLMLKKGTNVTLAESNGVVTISSTNTTYTSSDFTHDDLTGFISNEHIDWTADQGSTNIHTGNYTNTTYTGGTNISLSGTTFNHDDVSGGFASPAGTLSPIGTDGNGDQTVTLLSAVSHDDGHITGANTATLTFTGPVTVDSQGQLDITANSITANEIAANTITANEINANAITANEINANAITANEIAANAITANEIAANAITANEIAANAVTANEIAANAVTANEIAANAVTASEIAANAVTASEINADAVRAEQMQISNNSTGSAGIFMDYNSGNSRIDIRDASALRVRIGYLG